MHRSIGLPGPILVTALFAAGSSPIGLAQTTTDLGLVSLEDLMNIEITSASRKEQRADTVPAAVYVITQDDIRRSGFTALPDLFRLVPGMQVAQINANKWAVSARGLNGLYANTLLVLVDGRTVYNRLFSGVLWDALDIPLEDVDRIEIIRGPGAAIWGANAVDGVINIVTKATTATQGESVSASIGSFEPATAGAVRYGGSLMGASYRAFAKWSSTGASMLPGQASPGDSSHNFTSGARIDWAGSHDSVMLEGSSTTGRANALWLTPTQSPQPDASLVMRNESDLTGGSLTGRWVRLGPGGASFQLQSSLDLAHRLEPVGDYGQASSDVDLQYHTPVGTRHDLVAGLGYWFDDESFAGRNGYSVTPVASDLSVFNAFAQDDFALIARRLTLSLGAKVERDSEIGWQVEPTLRLLWTVVPERQHLWAAVSRAVVTPSLNQRGLQLNEAPVAGPGGLPVVASILGNPAYRPETAVSYEGGYRLAAGPVQFDIAGFAARYDGLQTAEPQTPQLAIQGGMPVLLVPVQLGNLLSADTIGVETSARWQATAAWRLEGNYSFLHLVPHLDPASLNLTAATFDGDAPQHQWQVRSQFTVAGRTDLDILLLHVGPLVDLGVPAYMRVDARVEWRFGSGLSAILTGQNLTDRSHAEFASAPVQALATQMPRSVSFGLAWRHK